MRITRLVVNDKDTQCIGVTVGHKFHVTVLYDAEYSMNFICPIPCVCGPKCIVRNGVELEVCKYHLKRI